MCTPLQDRLTTVCDRIYRLNLAAPTAKLCPTNYVGTLLHMLKHKLLASLRHAPTYKTKSGIVRGVVPAEMRYCFWVTGILRV